LANENRALEWSRQDDIDSSLIPQMYFDYLRGGPAEPLAGVFRHNQMDLRGLAALAGKILVCLIAAMVFLTQHTTARTIRSTSTDVPPDATPRRTGFARVNSMRPPYAQGSAPLRKLAKRELAQLAKREQDYTRATALWEELRPASTSAKRKKSAVTLEDTQKALEAAIEADRTACDLL